MSGPFRRRFGRSSGRGRLLTVVHAVSIGVGLAAAWMTLGPSCLYSLVSISVVGLLTVHVLRSPGGATVSYQTGLLSGVLAMSWLGLALAFHGLGVLWVCLLIATTTPVRTLWGHVREAARPSQDGAVAHGGRGGARAPTPPAADVGSVSAGIRRAVLVLPDLDVDALCVAWRRSYFQLLDTRSTPVTAAVVGYRQRILDEMDLRDPRGLSRWLDSLPRASGNPLPYLQAGTAPGDAPDGPGTQRPDPGRRQENDGTS